MLVRELRKDGVGARSPWDPEPRIARPQSRMPRG
jgi:hypothetical protein